jgi:hypothetical protein
VIGERAAGNGERKRIMCDVGMRIRETGGPLWVEDMDMR